MDTRVSVITDTRAHSYLPALSAERPRSRDTPAPDPGFGTTHSPRKGQGSLEKWLSPGLGQG